MKQFFTSILWDVPAIWWMEGVNVPHILKILHHLIKYDYFKDNFHNSGKPLHYHRDDSVEVFLRYGKVRNSEDKGSIPIQHMPKSSNF